MTKAIQSRITLLISVILVLSSTNVFAAGFVIDPAAIMTAWWNTNHWAGITAATILLAMIAATWKMPPVKNETKAQMISDLFRMARYIVGILFVVEYYSLIMKTIEAIIEMVT